jgi:magnesium chelatase subunit D
VSRKYVFPFPAVIGQDKVKKALILNVINPAIGGVLISGEKGTAKSTLVRGLAALMPGMDVVELPLNVTEDRLIGSIDIEKAVLEGRKSFEPGILKRAHGNILYVDEVNLLSEHIVNCLLEVSASGVNRVEREGISCSHESCFVLVGTMNPEEGPLRPQFLDRFGLYVEVKGSSDFNERKEIIRRRLEYEKAPDVYIKKWQEEAELISIKITKARETLPQIKVSESVMKLAAEIVMGGNCAGHRGELVIIETSRALAAYANRRNITVEDIKEAAEFALPHRVRQIPPQQTVKQEEPQEPDLKEPESDKQQNDTNENENLNENNENHIEQNNEEKPQGQRQENQVDEPENNNDTDSSRNNDISSKDEENVEEPGDIFEVRALNIQPLDKKKRKGSGKRIRTKTGSLQGRYIRYTFPKNKIWDIAFDATFRAAAPFQKYRERNGVAVAIQNSDFREKVREKRTGSTILFIVDASGSMGVKQRMKAVKGAILSLLNDAYQKRDRVGMIAFRKDSAQLLLGITRSVDLAQKKLRDLPTGGKTPLASGLYRGYEIIKAAKLKDPDMVPFIVLVSDGRANVSLKGGNPMDEALELANKIAAEGIKSLVIDTEKDFIKLGLASKIAEAMKADYYRLEELEAGEIAYTVRSFV